MTLPLYRNHNKPNNYQGAGNAGLWFDRFFDSYNEVSDWKVENKENKWLQKNFVAMSQIGNSNALDENINRQLALTQSLNGQNHVYTIQWHFVTGMGNPHPVENGFNWHPTLGVPYLTGATVKGLVRSWIEAWEPDDKENDKKQKLLAWFGSTDKKPTAPGYQSQAGEFIFFDALPIEPVRLGLDIMTPHMGKWYADGDKIESIDESPDKIPADWHDPVPVVYL